VEDKTVFLLLREGRAALRKRPASGLLAGLWEFPNVESALDEPAAAVAVRAWGLEPLAWKRRLTAKHIFSHVEWHMTGYALEVSGDGPEDFTWVDTLERHAVPSAFSRFTEEVRRELEE
jgi:A/G-specific adenine glycosylase